MTALLVGGIGKLGGAYRQAAHSFGAELVHAEKSLPSQPPRVAMVLVCTTVCSHPLLRAARLLAQAQGAPIHYLPRPSISCLRLALAGLDARRSA